MNLLFTRCGFGMANLVHSEVDTPVNFLTITFKSSISKSTVVVLPSAECPGGEPS